MLEACLHTGSRARDGWSRWCLHRAPSGRSARVELSRTRTLLPLLARSMTRNRLEARKEVLSYVRAAVLREELRADRLRGIVTDVVSALEGRGVRPVVVRGVALAATVYETWTHRHCHDIDLLLAPERLGSGAIALTRFGCVPIRSRGASVDTVLMQHPSGLQIALHARLFAVDYYNLPVDRFADSGERISISGVPISILSPGATLVHVLGHATYSSSRSNLRWVADAWHLLAAHPELDWGEVVDRLQSHRLTLPVAVLLRYLHAFGMRIPSDMVAVVERRAAARMPVAEDVSIGAALAARGGDLRSLWRSSGNWRGRARIARWMIAPTSGYLRSTFAPRSSWHYPFVYSYRLFRFVSGRLARRRRVVSSIGVG